eukprot:scaffold124243_cov31-Tisochrysis_lutea.AAC.1
MHRSGQAAVAQRAMSALRCGTVHIEPNWLAGESLANVRGAAAQLLLERGTAGHVGRHARLDTTARRCLTADLLEDETLAALGGKHPSLLDVLRQLDELRSEMARRGRSLLPHAEVQLLRYDPGGHYERHIDAGAGMAGKPVCRSVSLLLYLTPEDWSDRDGGKLRVFLPNEDDNGLAASGHVHEEHLDIRPAAGTLLVFDSATVPHAVLPTARERIVCVAWFLSKRIT